MDFRQYQKEAKRATVLLGIAFSVAVAATVYLLGHIVAWSWVKLGFLKIYRLPPDSELAFAGIFLIIILGHSLYQLIFLSEGGYSIARALNAKRIPNEPDPYHQKVRNVMEEMCIAAKIRKPHLFVLDSDCINAFAAGWTQKDAVICVTRGAIEKLTRNELQGVIAHEIAHILHGDMRLNMYLVAAIGGLQGVTNLGRGLFEGGRSFGAFGVVAGLGIMAGGSVGWFAGQIIKATFNKQREYHADATAVELTRDLEGLGSALRKAAFEEGAGRAGLNIQNTKLPQFSHMFLLETESSDISFLKNHPKLGVRIEKIYGKYLPPVETDVVNPRPDNY